MKLRLMSIYVDDQDKALNFYTEVLGFVKKVEISMGKFKWLTVVSAEEPDGMQLILAANENPAAKTYQQAMAQQSTPAAMFYVADIQMEYARLKTLGVKFTMEPMKVPGHTIAVLDDTCGNLIQIMQAG